MPERIIDLRSDTVTRPTPAMREAIARAEVGDDVLGDDPTVKRLEERMAKLLGKEAALYVPSGTMSNVLAVMSQTRPGDEVILDRRSHIFNYEVAGAAVMGGVQLCPTDGPSGLLPIDDLASFVRPPNIHHPVTSLIEVENTHNRAGGRVYPIDQLERVSLFARERRLRVHMDGARLANAFVASGVPFERYGALADSITFCFSKGLGAPVGSALVSDAPTIEKARVWRKRLGGGMRQVGILAAACLYALDHNIARLAEDHAKAARIGELVTASGRYRLTFPVETNIVIFERSDCGEGMEKLAAVFKEHGVLSHPFSSRHMRMVTHLDILDEDMERLERAIVKVLGG